MMQRREKLFVVVFVVLFCVSPWGSVCWGYSFPFGLYTGGFEVMFSDVKFDHSVYYYAGPLVQAQYVLAYNVNPDSPLERSYSEENSFLFWVSSVSASGGIMLDEREGFGDIGEGFMLHKGTFFGSTGWDELQLRFNLSLYFAIWDTDFSFLFAGWTPEFPVSVVETRDDMSLTYPEGVPPIFVETFGHEYVITLELPTDTSGAAGTFTITQVPEPVTMLLLGSGLLGLAGYGRKKLFKK